MEKVAGPVAGHSLFKFLSSVKTVMSATTFVCVNNCTISD